MTTTTTTTTMMMRNWLLMRAEWRGTFGLTHAVRMGVGCTQRTRTRTHTPRRTGERGRRRDRPGRCGDRAKPTQPKRAANRSTGPLSTPVRYTHSQPMPKHKNENGPARTRARTHKRRGRECGAVRSALELGMRPQALSHCLFRGGGSREGGQRRSGRRCRGRHRRSASQPFRCCRRGSGPEPARIRQRRQ